MGNSSVRVENQVEFRQRFLRHSLTLQPVSLLYSEYERHLYCAGSLDARILFRYLFPVRKRSFYIERSQRVPETRIFVLACYIFAVGSRQGCCVVQVSCRGDKKKRKEKVIYNAIFFLQQRGVYTRRDRCQRVPESRPPRQTLRRPWIFAVMIAFENRVKSRRPSVGARVYRRVTR